MCLGTIQTCSWNHNPAHICNFYICLAKSITHTIFVAAADTTQSSGGVIWLASKIPIGVNANGWYRGDEGNIHMACGPGIVKRYRSTNASTHSNTRYFARWRAGPQACVAGALIRRTVIVARKESVLLTTFNLQRNIQNMHCIFIYQSSQSSIPFPNAIYFPVKICFPFQQYLMRN